MCGRRFLKRQIATIAPTSERICQRESQAIKTREEGEQEGQEEVQKQDTNPQDGVTDIDLASPELRVSCDRSNIWCQRCPLKHLSKLRC